MTDVIRHMPKPCEPSARSGACPFRRDADPGEFPAQRFELLADTAGLPGAEVPIGGPIFACHHSADGSAVACSGWLKVCGYNHLGIRFAIATRQISPEAVRIMPEDPELFESYDEMAAAQSAGVYRRDAADRSRRRVGHGNFVASRLLGGGQCPTGAEPGSEYRNRGTQR